MASQGRCSTPPAGAALDPEGRSVTMPYLQGRGAAAAGRGGVKGRPGKRSAWSCWQANGSRSVWGSRGARGV